MDNPNLLANKTKENFEIIYDLNKEDVKQGLYIFQKKYIFKKYIIYSIIFGFIFLIYMFTFISNSFNSMAVIMMLLCIFGVSFIWFSLYNQRARMIKSIEMTNFNFSINIYSDKVQVKDNYGINNFLFSDNIEVIDTNERFIISINKEKIYILPKRCIESSLINNLINIFKNNLNDKYSVYSN